MASSPLLSAICRSLGLCRRSLPVCSRNVIVITGCDSGLGHSLAVYCHNALNMTVVSCCHNLCSEGARLLKQLNGEDQQQRMHIYELDLLQPASMERVEKELVSLLDSDEDYVFTALVNNAGVMCFGEFEWQTPGQVEHCIGVNVLGTMRLTKQLLPLVRQKRARIINVTSHCGLQALPALGPYAASKAALRFWNDALRMELQQYGVEVINFVPGSFVMASNIAARQQDQAFEMFAAFNEEQRNHYGAYFKEFNTYLRILSGFKAPNQFQDEQLLSKFRDALTSRHPKALYIHEPWRYKIYRWLFRLCPTPLVDWLAVQFCAMPSYRSVTDRKHST
ncbi:D-beta-hydroxybutyrate dehydrogenase, mitochondrial [Scaptodrosophila lebanonensis]|uniref:D-beta-hydroxybutyrate dehydrogenase, mitochondrial n=1 Tax=Drosophila lebanonensis TaxID=7225 RepID=A0A6J2T760_DROLE|nr:D-beta-hydroxybutyrate dehydrogenase, mitochondrial [Scaptodrosophila lebanonensis]